MPEIELDILKKNWESLKGDPDLIPFYLSIDVFNYVSKLNYKAGGDSKKFVTMMTLLINCLVSQTHNASSLIEKETEK